MSACKLEFCLLVMIKAQVLPTMGIMAFLAILAFIPTVNVIVFVTSITICRGFLVLILRMAVDAFHGFMFAVEPEFGLVVIKQHLVPAD